MARVLAVAVVLLLTTACTSRPRCPSPAPAPGRDVAGVIAAVFAHIFSENDDRHLAVADRLEPDEGVLMVPYGREDYDPEAALLADVRQRLPALHADTAKDFVHRQHGSEPLPGGIAWPAGVDLDAADAFEDWEGFYREHPASRGILTFAPVGFSLGRRQALVFYSLVREGLDGSGNVVLLERVGGTWRVVAKENVWIA